MLIESALVALSATLAAAVTSLEVQGNRFVNPKTHDEFQIVGMAYQIGGSAGYEPSAGKDPLSDGKICTRDAAIMQKLGINTIRVYNSDPDLNHDDCASIFNAAGIYMVLDVNSPLSGESINSAEPWTSYYAAYLNRTFAVVEAFKSYPNTLAFFSGNEVMSDVATGATVPPYVRAVTRDLKNYISKHSDRTIPVGYSAADVRSILKDSFEYFQCAIDGDQDDMSRADLFALNSYSWCGNSSFTESGYDKLVDIFKGNSIPVFFSEFGCNDPQPRVFTEIQAIYGDQMTPTFSGGVVYEYYQEDNNYGLAEIDYTGDNSVSLMSDYNVLQDQYKKVDWTSVQGVKSTSNGTSTKAPTCSASLITGSSFYNNFTLPVLPPGAQAIINKGVTPTPSGKLVDISSYKVTYQVTDSDGNAMSNLAVTPLAANKFNVLGGNTAVSGTSGSGSSNSSSDSTSTVTKGSGTTSTASPVSSASPSTILMAPSSTSAADVQSTSAAAAAGDAAAASSGGGNTVVSQSSSNSSASHSNNATALPSASTAGAGGLGHGAAALVVPAVIALSFMASFQMI